MEVSQYVITPWETDTGVTLIKLDSTMKPFILPKHLLLLLRSGTHAPIPMLLPMQLLFLVQKVCTLRLFFMAVFYKHHVSGASCPNYS